MSDPFNFEFSTHRKFAKWGIGGVYLKPSGELWRTLGITPDSGDNSAENPKLLQLTQLTQNACFLFLVLWVFVGAIGNWNLEISKICS